MSFAAAAIEEQMGTDFGPLDGARLYPSYARWDAGRKAWLIQVRGTIYQRGPEDVRAFWLIRLMERFLGGSHSPHEKAIFERRISPFLAMEHRGRKVGVWIGDRLYALQNRTVRGGHFQEMLVVPGDEASGGSMLEVTLAGANGEPTQYSTTAQLIPSEGISVVSDLDDTIKRTEVNSGQGLMANTFLRDFVAVDGMGDLYRSWAEQDAVFHYVSSSPHQLGDSIEEFLCGSEFPTGSIHLSPVASRSATVWGVLQFLWDFYQVRRRTKSQVIHRLLRHFPDRRFILVGDSSERDLEMYADIARNRPQQIAQILIRQVPGHVIPPLRRQNAAHDLTRSLFSFFHEPAQIEQHIFAR